MSSIYLLQLLYASYLNVSTTLINNAARGLGDWSRVPRFSSLPQYLWYLTSILHYCLD